MLHHRWGVLHHRTVNVLIGVAQDGRAAGVLLKARCGDEFEGIRSESSNCRSLRNKQL